MIHDDEGLIDVYEVMDVFLYNVISFQHWAVGIYTPFQLMLAWRFGKAPGCCMIIKKAFMALDNPNL